MFKYLFTFLLAFGLLLPATRALSAAYDTESITVSSTAIGFDAAIYDKGDGNKPVKVVFVVETDQIRFTVDGTTPTTSVGLLAEIGDIVTIRSFHDVQVFKAIRITTDATIQPVYFNSVGE